MHLSHQTVLLIHEERVNEMLGKQLEDHDNGIGAGLQRMWRDWQDKLQQNASVENRAEPRISHRTTQELAMVGKK